MAVEASAEAALPLGERKTFDGSAVKSAFALLLTKVAKPAAGAAKGILIITTVKSEVADIKRTISDMSGKGVIEHNRRTYIAENVDPERTHLNIEYCYTPIKQAYHELFDEALPAYNAKQKRKDRCIENYCKKICDGDQEKPFYEVIFQIGNKDNMSAASENRKLARAIWDKFMRSFQERNPHLHVFSAHLHMDEATPHLHIDFIPYTIGSKRGLSTRVSLKQALADQGITGQGSSMTERAV